jgi:cytochrome c oxidase subunit IV
MGHLSYEEGKKVVFKGFVILGIVTILEVMVALVGKGYIIEGFHLPTAVMYLLMIGMSLYKAYFIVYEFMHMRYEVPGLVKSVLMPTLLLIWAVIAFFYEGNTWYHWRKQIADRPISQFTHTFVGKTSQTKHEPASDTIQLNQTTPAIKEEAH